MSEFHNKLILRLSLESKQNAVILLAGRWSLVMFVIMEHNSEHRTAQKLSCQ